MRVLFFNVGESKRDISPIAKYAKGVIDNQEFNDVMVARDMGFGATVNDDESIVIKGDDVEYKGQFLCYAKDLFSKHLTQVGREQVLDTMNSLSVFFKSETDSKIYVCLPNQMNHEEVVSILYNAMLKNGQELYENNITHDDRLMEFEDYKQKIKLVDGETKTDKALREGYEKGVLSFVQDLTSPKAGLEDDALVIIVGGNELYETMMNNKKIQRYCLPFDSSQRGKLQPGATRGLLIGSPKTVFEKILG